MKSWLVALASLGIATGVCAEDIDELVALMDGSFVAADRSFIYRRLRISAAALGDHVVYLQVNRGADLELYRQRILTLSEDPETNTVIETVWTLADAPEFEDARRDDPGFATLSFDDLGAAMASGCEQRWRRLADSWSGTVDPATCRIVSKRTGRPRRIQSEIRLSDSGIKLVERGFDDSGKQQLFGTPPGEWLELRRVRTAEER